MPLSVLGDERNALITHEEDFEENDVRQWSRLHAGEKKLEDREISVHHMLGDVG